MLSHWTLFTDALDESRKLGKRGVRKERVGYPKRRLEDLQIKQMKRAEQAGKRIDSWLAANPGELPPKEVIAALDSVGAQIRDIGRELRFGREAENKARAGLTDDELDAVWRTELRRIASKLSEEDWRVLLCLGFGDDVAEAALVVFRERRDPRLTEGAK